MAPTSTGRFGGLQGTGGLEAVILDATGTTTGVINDQFGNGVATVSGGTVTWNTTRVGAYGPLPGVQAQTLTDVSQLAAATAWRSRRIDPTGFYWLGARYYEPASGRFLSADPMGQAASPSLYDYAGGDPVNRSDPDGRADDDTYVDPLQVWDFQNRLRRGDPAAIQAMRQEGDQALWNGDGAAYYQGKVDRTSTVAATTVIAGPTVVVVTVASSGLADTPLLSTTAGLKLLGTGAGVGAGAAVIGTGANDLIRNDPSSPETYVSNAFGGALGGASTVATGNPMIGGAISGEVSTFLDDYLNSNTVNPQRLAFNTTLGSITGWVANETPWLSWQGVNSGQNSYGAIAAQITTKTANGSISDFSSSTLWTIAQYEAYQDLTRSSIYGSFQSYLDAEMFGKNLTIQQDPTGKHTKPK